MHSTFYRRCFMIAITAVLAYALYELLIPLRSVIQHRRAELKLCVRVTVSAVNTRPVP